MPVTFISNGYDTTSTNPYTEAAWADAHPAIGLARYGVRSPLDWKVTAVAGLDRTVSINAGRGFGHGITDKTVDNETIQLDVIASGSRWDLIVCRRDWTPTAGESKFMKINGGATAVIPGGRTVGPGNIDDQPIALVQVTAGQTQPTAIIDLRTWAGDGGGLIANDDLVRSYLNSTGTRLNINGQDWIRRVGANDTPEWYGPDEPTIYAPLPVSGYSLTGDIAVEPAGSKKRVTVDINVTRTGAAGTIPKDDWASFGAVIPTGARGDADPDYLPASVIGGSTSTATTNAHATVFLNPSNGLLQIRGVGTFTWNTGALCSISTTYYI